MMDIDSISAPAFLVGVRPDGTFRYEAANAAHGAVSGLFTEEIRGRCPSDIHPPHANAALLDHYRECVRSRCLVEYQSTALLPRGVTTWRTSLIPLIDSQGSIAALVGLWKDITDADLHVSQLESASYLARALDRLRQREIQLEAEAHRDPLTNLFNRRGLRRSLTMQVRSDPDPRRLGVLLIDLDGFKAVNDRHGHATGDEVLTEVARRMVGAVPDTAICARMGGDEFTVVIDGPNAQDTALCKRALSAALCEPLERRGLFIPMGASIGQAFGSVIDGDLSPLLAEADDELYAIKRIRRKHASAAAGLATDCLDAEIERASRPDQGRPMADRTPIYLA